ncbi:hypothetical protein AFLA_003101 [Aspergillus flavus NRRL3357]|nr:hypothetical protein AFLA_003101 [Aspergillus flavus NRRL3357]
MIFLHTPVPPVNDSIAEFVLKDFSYVDVRRKFQTIRASPLFSRLKTDKVSMSARSNLNIWIIVNLVTGEQVDGMEGNWSRVVRAFT